QRIGRRDAEARPLARIGLRELHCRAGGIGGGGAARAGTGSRRSLGAEPRAAEVARLRGIGRVVRNGGLRGAAADRAAGRGVAGPAECLALLEGLTLRWWRLRVEGRQRCEQRGRERDKLAG